MAQVLLQGHIEPGSQFLLLSGYVLRAIEFGLEGEFPQQRFVAA